MPHDDPHVEYPVDNATRHLNDRLFATVLDSLQITRDLLRAKGMTGNDCQAALDVLYQGITPATNGISYRLGQHERLMAGRIVHGDDDGQDLAAKLAAQIEREVGPRPDDLPGL